MRSVVLYCALILFPYYKGMPEDKLFRQAFIVEENFKPLMMEEDGTQTYSFRFKTSNGIEREEFGTYFPDKEKGLTVSGRFSYPTTDGYTYSVAYTADKWGFRINPATKLEIDGSRKATLDLSRKLKDMEAEKKEREEESEGEIQPRILTAQLASLAG